MKLIGITGPAGSGKSTAASILEKKHGFAAVALADPMKRALRDWYGWSEETLWGPSSFRNAEDTRLPIMTCTCNMPARSVGNTILGDAWCLLCRRPVHVGQKCLSARLVLQLLGTDFGRVLHEDTWIDCGLRTAKQCEEGLDYSPTRGCFHTDPLGSLRIHEGVVIPDVRFANEARKIREAGGSIWRIVPSQAPNKLTGGIEGHASELGIPDELVDATLVNPFDERLEVVIVEHLRSVK
ncbi:MAG: hypothetical protein V2A73_13785 [Pseudomonadota bacterium]